MLRKKAHENKLRQGDLTEEENEYLGRLSSVRDAEKIVEECKYSVNDIIVLKKVDALRLGLINQPIKIIRT